MITYYTLFGGSTELIKAHVGCSRQVWVRANLRASESGHDPY